MSDKQLKGQMSIFDFPECIPERKPVQKEVCKSLSVPETFADYVGRCEYCQWGQDELTCIWSIKNPDKFKALSPAHCHEAHEFWKPNSCKIPKLCGNCRYSNCFCCKCEGEKYDKDRILRRDLNKPIEEPNIYCTRHDGSVNRSRPYEEYCENGFGTGHWHRQREWDTCDAWELDTEFHKNLKGGEQHV